MNLLKIIITLAVGGFLVLYLPAVLLLAESPPDAAWIEILAPGSWLEVGALAASLMGLGLALWTVVLQLKKGRGTPVPALPPEKLLVEAPYTFCRNPMVLGMVIYYGGLCPLIPSWTNRLWVAAASILLLVYVKVIEEPGLESRFGVAYREYRKATPFLLPRLFRKR